MDDLSLVDATGQAELVSSGQVSPVELVDAAIERIERLNPRINAVIHTDFDRARHEAASGLPDGPFRGVPFLLKDIGANQAGLPYWAGNRALKAMGNIADRDTELGSRFRQAGLVTLGKTNLPELGSCPTTQPLSCGPTNNPWDLERSPSGSSGGAAAAVASGMVPVAHANDGGGSTRLPASWNGLVGLKPTRGMVPNPANISRLTSELVVSRTVRDTAGVLAAVRGTVDADLYALHPKTHVVDRSSLRVAVITDGNRIEIDLDCAQAVEATARVLTDMGHHVEPVASKHLIGDASRVNGELWMAGLARRVTGLGEMTGRPLTADEVEPYNWAAAQRGMDMPAHEWLESSERQQRWSADAIDWMSAYDVLITPTAGVPPMRTDELWPPEDKPWRISRSYARIGLFTLPFNVTGQPAISLPLHQTEAGLPVGVQLVAHMGHDDLLLSLSAELEQAMPWADRLPPVHAVAQ